jgi:hypothetical protein
MELGTLLGGGLQKCVRASCVAGYSTCMHGVGIAAYVFDNMDLEDVM